MKRMIELNKLIEQFPKVAELLNDCPYSILEKFVIERFPKGKFKLHKQTIYNHIYIVVDGKVNIFLESESGKQVTLDVYTSGSFIGEHEILKQVPYSSSVQSLSEVILLKLPRASFLRWLDIDRNMTAKLIDSLCNQIYKLSVLTESYSMFSTKEQIVHILSKLNEKNSTIERSQLLGRVSSTSRSVDRILKELKEEAIISNQNGVIQVIDHKKLALFGG